VRFFAALILILAIATSTSMGQQGSTDRTYRWDGHDFVFCFVTDDGNRANLAWADTAMVMDFRFTIAVNVNVDNKAGSDRKLSHAEMHALAADGFEIAHHGRTHGMGGLATSCSVPPRGSLMGYFLCDEPCEEERMLALMAEISRDTLAYHCELPLSSIRVMAYPRHRHGIALIDSLIAEGFIGARTGGKW
jgi:hypothetical protein